MATATAAVKAAKTAKSVARALDPKPQTMGSTIDEMFDLREEKRQLDAQAKKLEDQIRELEEKLLERMTAEGTDKAAGKKATVSITTGVVADVQDWTQVEAFVKKSGNFQLFQRRISEPAFRELLETKGAVPGISPFTKRKVNLRVI